jgi:opacity protein-like surface antigen
MTTVFRVFLSLAVAALSAAAQPVSFGVKGGVNLRGWFLIEPGRNIYTDESSRYTFGPMLEFRLPCHFAVEVDALYRRYGSTSGGGIGGFYFSEKSSAGTWEFPALAKYRLGSGPLRPFISAGPTFRRVGKQTEVSTCTGSLCGSSEGTQTSTESKFTSLGVALGGGAELRKARPRLSAEIRYTRFERDRNDIAGNQMRTDQDQFAILFGIAF